MKDKTFLTIRYFLAFILFVVILIFLSNYFIASSEYYGVCTSFMIGCANHTLEYAVPALTLTPFFVTLLVSTFLRKKVHFLIWVGLVAISLVGFYFFYSESIRFPL